MKFERVGVVTLSRQSSMWQLCVTPWGSQTTWDRNDRGKLLRWHMNWRRSPHKSREVLKHYRSWHTNGMQELEWSGVWWGLQDSQRCWGDQPGRWPPSPAMG